MADMERVAPNYPCDLHSHTNLSDGADTPQEFIDHAAVLGMKVIAMTDHDVVAPGTLMLKQQNRCVSIEKYAAEKGIILLRGIEISCETEVEDVHLVCFGCDWNDDFFFRLEEEVVKSKIESYQLLVEKLKEDGIDLTWEEVLDNHGNPVPESKVQKKMIFELIAAKGYVDSWSQAKLMVKNTPKYQVKRRKPDPVSVIAEIHRCGGIVIMAHPYLVNEPVKLENETLTREEYIDRLILAGLDGIEACYPYDKTSYGGALTKEEIEKEVRGRYTGRLQIISGGSDYHADAKKGVKNPRELGECGITENYLRDNPLLQRLITKNNQIRHSQI